MLPVMSYQFGLGDPGQIALERERGDVHFEAAGDGARLRPAALIRLLKLDLPPGPGLPATLKFGNDRFAVSLARRRIGSERQRSLAAGTRLPSAACGGQQQW